MKILSASLVFLFCLSSQASRPVNIKPSWLATCWAELKGENRYRLNLTQTASAEQEVRELVHELAVRGSNLQLEDQDREALRALWRPCFEPGVWQRDSGGAYEAAGFLAPLKPFRSLIRWIDWEEHLHGTPSDFGKNPGVVNYVWGSVKNTRAEDFFAIGITQIPFSDRFLLDFVLGPLDERSAIQPSFSWARGRDSDLRWVHLNGKSFLLARRLELRFGNLAAFEELVRRIQDLYLDQR